MEIIQKKGSVTHTFTFHMDYLNFAYKDKTGSGDVDINYADIPKKSSVQIQQNHWLKNVGMLWVGLGILQLGYAVYSNAALNGKGFWLFLGAILIAWSHFRKIKYTVMSTDHGSIFVIEDKKHDQIINELNARKKVQLLEWYGEINPEIEIEKEIAKFNWLVEQEAMTKDEAEKKILQAQLMSKQHMEDSTSKLN